MKRVCAKVGGDGGERYRMMPRDRFLCRVFSGENRLLVLKVGSNLLACIPDARCAGDLDFGMRARLEPAQAPAELEAPVSMDLGDLVRAEVEESLDENGCSRLLKLRYAMCIGEEEKDPVLIDLSLDCETTPVLPCLPSAASAPGWCRGSPVSTARGSPRVSTRMLIRVRSAGLRRRAKYFSDAGGFATSTAARLRGIK